MVAAQMILEAADEAQKPVDYYAGISALGVVILFAKFSTHNARGNRTRADAEREGGKKLHVLCVVLAWLAIALSLLVLAWGNFNETAELLLRIFVAILAA